MRNPLLTVLPSLLVLAAAGATTAREWRVDPAGAAAPATIQAAVDAAADGDLILLADGVFTGPGNRDVDLRGKALTLRSAAGDAERCVIDCRDGDGATAHRGFLFVSGEGPQTLLAALTIRDGRAPGQGIPDGLGGAVLCAASSPRLQDLVVEGGRAGLGGGVGCLDARPTLVRCLIRDSTAEHGGGVMCLGSDAVFEGCALQANTAESGGGLGVRACRPQLRDCILAGNLGTYGGGLAVTGGAVARLEDCLLVGNVAILGGGLHAADAEARLAGCTLVAGSAGAGGGVFCESKGAVVLERTIVGFSVQGEGVYCREGGRAELSCCLVFANGDGDWVGPLAAQRDAAGNLWTNPLFVDPQRGDFTLRADSPCLAGAGGCGRIGAP